MFVRWQLFPYFYFLLSLPLLSFSSLSNIPYLTFMKVIVSSSISPLFSLFSPYFSLSPFSVSLSLSLFFYFVFVHWLGTKSNTWPGFKRIKLEIFVSHNFSGSQLLYLQFFFFSNSLKSSTTCWAVGWKSHLSSLFPNVYFLSGASAVWGAVKGERPSCQWLWSRIHTCPYSVHLHHLLASSDKRCWAGRSWGELSSMFLSGSAVCSSSLRKRQRVRDKLQEYFLLFVGFSQCSGRGAK